MSNSSNDTRQAWDPAYAGGKYVGEPPVAFTQEIIAFVQLQLPPESRGLYVGCGNGRNFIPLVKAGLHLDGNDLSGKGIAQIRTALPEYEGTLNVGNFHDMTGEWDYVISLQVFQHGNKTYSAEHFAHAARLLKLGGYMFLRINAASTQLDLEHEIIEGDDGASRTIRFLQGHKAESGIPIHFYEQAELEALAPANGFTIITPPKEDRTYRKPPREGFWSQWETIWQKLNES